VLLTKGARIRNENYVEIMSLFVQRGAGPVSPRGEHNLRCHLSLDGVW
jgi:hypothetical protein